MVLDELEVVDAVLVLVSVDDEVVVMVGVVETVLLLVDVEVDEVVAVLAVVLDELDWWMSRLMKSWLCWLWCWTNSRLWTPCL